MKRAFTMIELIFVIVIIGILAAIALPKLNATRDDATVSTMISNARIAVYDIGSYISASGTTHLDSAKVDSATRIDFNGAGCADLDENTTDLSPVQLTLCDESVTPASPCITINVSDNGDVEVINASGSPTSICQVVAIDSAIISLAGIADDPNGKVYHFAGEHIKR